MATILKRLKLKNQKSILGAFAVILIVILVVGLIGTVGVNRIFGDVKSMFYDRLYPAVEMAKITEKLYENRLNLEEHLTSVNTGSMQVLEQKIYKNNILIDSLTEKYAGTHLVAEEKGKLREYRREIFLYRKIENKIIEQSRRQEKSEAFQAFSKEGYEEFRRMMEPIHEITDTQAQIGSELYKDSERAANRVRWALYSAMIIVVLIVSILGTLVAFNYLHE